MFPCPVAPDSSAVVITVVVVVTLLLIAGFALIFYRLWSTKMKGINLQTEKQSV